MLYLVDKVGAVFSPDYKIQFSKALLKRIESKHKEENVKQSVAAYLLLGGLLKDSGYSLKDIRFFDNGKPYIENGPNISVSHTGDFVCAAVSDMKVGIDAELIGEIRESVINKFFNQNEIDYITAENSNERFYTLWTVKEALSKVSGRGVGEIRSINLEISDGVISYENFNIVTEIRENCVISVCFSEKTGF